MCAFLHLIDTYELEIYNLGTSVSFIALNRKLWKDFSGPVGDEVMSRQFNN